MYIKFQPNWERNIKETYKTNNARIDNGIHALADEIFSRTDEKKRCEVAWSDTRRSFEV
jgi:hypothetical protein